MANDEVRHFCGMVDGLAFLPVADLPEGMAYLKENLPDVPEMAELLAYFDNTYVSGQPRSINSDRQLVLRLRRSPPTFPPNIWNVHDATLANQERTNNELLQDVRGQLPAKRQKRSYVQQQQRLHTICIERSNGTKTVAESLQRLGHCIRLIS